jgi:uncharacterized protein YrrD
VQRASEVVGRSVVVREGGETVGKIKDIVLDPSGRMLLGFVISENLFSNRVAPWAGVQAIGPDSVVLAVMANVVKAEEAPDIKAVLDKDLRVRGLRLQTTTGKDLGKIEDVRFDERTGGVLGYELTGGIFGHGSFMPTPLNLELGKDLAFVGPEVEETITKE